MSKSEIESFEDAREAARAILDREGRREHIPTGKFISGICSEANVDRQTAVLILDELKENGLTDYTLGKGFLYPDQSVERTVEEANSEEIPLSQRRIDFLHFLEAIRS